MTEKESQFPSDRTDASITAVSLLASAVPWLGGPISSVVAGYGQKRKLDRVQELLDGLAKELSDFESEVSKEYVRTEEFEELMEQALRRTADERHAEVRSLYLRFIHRAITEPSDEYDEQMEVFRVIERLRKPHVSILQALRQEPGPEADKKYMGSPLQTLEERTGLDPNVLDSAVGTLNDLRLTNTGSLRVMMTGHGSESLQHTVTPLGMRVLDYIREF